MDKIILWAYKTNQAYDRLPEPRRFLTFIIPLIFLLSLNLFAKVNGMSEETALVVQLLVFVIIFAFRFPFSHGFGTRYLRNKNLIN